MAVERKITLNIYAVAVKAGVFLTVISFESVKGRLACQREEIKKDSASFN